MSENEWLVSRFELDRQRLRSVAFRVLGSMSEAEDAVQEAWLRVSRADATAVENMSGWLTTIVARVSLNMLQSRKSRREDLVDVPDDDTPGIVEGAPDPEQEALLADSVGAAMLVILDTLSPAERLAFVLHDMFAVPFEDIAPIVNRSPAAARQLASRARRRIQRQGGSAGEPAQDDGPRNAGQGTVGHGAGGQGAAGSGEAGGEGEKAGFIQAFLAASREGNFEALLATLAPGIVVRTDEPLVRMGKASGMDVPEEINGADAVSRAFVKLSWSPVPVLVNGRPGLAYAPNGVPRAVYQFAFEDGLIARIDVQADLTGLDVVLC